VILDIVIAAVIVVALLIGYQRGVIQPLLVEIFFFGALLIILRDRKTFSIGLQHYLHVTNSAFDVFAALLIAIAAGYIGGVIGHHLHRMPLLQGVDGFLGIFVHVAIAILALYVIVSALAVMDKALAPTLKAATLTGQQVTQLRKTMASNPITAGLVDPRDYDHLQADAKKPGGARYESVDGLRQVHSVYYSVLQPQLTSSRLAPFLLTIGVHVPVFGHIGPGDLPPPESPKPSPTPSVTPKR
jgi:hypothetical protein